jgi:hypothetical protein
MRYVYRNIRFHVFLGGLVLSLPMTWEEFVEWTDVSGLWKGIGFIAAVTVGFIYTWLETRRKDPDKRVSVMLWVLFVVAILMNDIMVLYYRGGVFGLAIGTIGGIVWNKVLRKGEPRSAKVKS